MKPMRHGDIHDDKVQYVANKIRYYELARAAFTKEMGLSYDAAKTQHAHHAANHDGKHITDIVCDKVHKQSHYD